MRAVAVVAVAFAAVGLTVAVADFVWPESSTPSTPVVPVAQMSNDEFLDLLGTTVTVEQGCIFWTGLSDGISTYIFFDPDAREDAVRIVAVCAPTRKPVGLKQ